jgi:hypothetical protein
LRARTFALDAGVPPSDPVIAEAGPQADWSLHVTLYTTVPIANTNTAFAFRSQSPIKAPLANHRIQLTVLQLQV